MLARDFASAREGFAACTTLVLSAADRCEAWFGLAEAALGEGDRAAAASALLEAAAQGPARRRFDALVRRAGLLEEDGEFEAAVDALDHSLALAPLHAGAVASLKRVLVALENYEGLAELLTTLATRTPRA